VRRAAVITMTVISLFSLFQIVTVAQGLRGEAVEHALTVDGISRKYLIFAPKGTDKPLPVVLALHGSGSKARQMERYTLFDDLAAKKGFLVVYPEAVDGKRNGGHTWAGRPLYLPEMLIGKARQEFSATDVIWEFFKSCPPRLADPATKNSK